MVVLIVLKDPRLQLRYHIIPKLYLKLLLLYSVYELKYTSYTRTYDKIYLRMHLVTRSYIFYAFAIYMNKTNYDDIIVHKNHTYDISIDT